LSDVQEVENQNVAFEPKSMSQWTKLNHVYLLCPVQQI
jgi:hypothetical protein